MDTRRDVLTSNIITLIKHPNFKWKCIKGTHKKQKKFQNLPGIFNYYTTIRNTSGASLYPLFALLSPETFSR